jgi:hypothetical protein
VEAVYREGVLNTRADPLSRGKNPRSRGFTSRNSFTRLTAPPILKELSILLGPSLNIMEEERLVHHWTEYTRIIQDLFFRVEA